MKKDDLLLPFIKTLHHLHNPEHQEYVSRIMTLGILVLAINAPELTALWNKFIKYGAIEDLLFNQPKSAEETGRITELNTKRALTFTYILKFLDNVIKRSPDDALRAKFDAIFTKWNAYTQQFERVLSQRGIETTHGKPSVDFDNMLPDTPQPPSPPDPPPFGE